MIPHKMALRDNEFSSLCLENFYQRLNVLESVVILQSTDNYMLLFLNKSYIIDKLFFVWIIIFDKL